MKIRNNNDKDTASDKFKKAVDWKLFVVDLSWFYGCINNKVWQEEGWKFATPQYVQIYTGKKK